MHWLCRQSRNVRSRLKPVTFITRKRDVSTKTQHLSNRAATVFRVLAVFVAVLSSGHLLAMRSTSALFPVLLRRLLLILLAHRFRLLPFCEDHCPRRHWGDKGWKNGGVWRLVLVHGEMTKSAVAEKQEFLAPNA